MDELKILKMLCPKGTLWNYGEKFNSFLECFANRIKELREYENNIVRESLPYTASDSISDWLKMYEIQTTNNALLDAKLLRLYSNAFGGQSIEYLNNLIQKEYPNIEIRLENNKTTITITGEINTTVEYLMFIDFVEKIFPAYCLSVFSIEVLENFGQYGLCNLAISGVARCNNIPNTISEGDKYENK